MFREVSSVRVKVNFPYLLYNNYRVYHTAGILCDNLFQPMNGSQETVQQHQQTT